MRKPWYSLENLERCAKLLLRFRKKFPGRGYIYFARIGLTITGLAIAGVLPGFRDIFIAILVNIGTGLGIIEHNSGQQSAQLANWLPEIILLMAFVSGILMILTSAHGYHKFLFREAPGMENEGAISLNVASDKNPFILIQQVAKQTSNIVDIQFKNYRSQEYTMLDGPLSASDFLILIEKIARRTKPQNIFDYKTDGEIYQIFPTGK